MTNQVSYSRTVVIQPVVALLLAAACTTPNPSHRPSPSDAAADATGDAGSDPINDASSDGPKLCTANQVLRCDANKLVRCNGSGTAELTESCPLGCHSVELRCNNLRPSNGLVTYLDKAMGQPDRNFGESATIDTNSGEVRVDGVAVDVPSEIVSQNGGPDIRVFAVRSLTVKHVVVIGLNALAITAHGDIAINGEFFARAGLFFASSGCSGQRSSRDFGGAGGGGFGSPGGAGGSAFGPTGTTFDSGGVAGMIAGNAELIPLRGGCGGGFFGGSGGGAVQLVSRTQIVVRGALAANGRGSPGGGGGSGGGILLEAPIVEVLGHLVANGGSGAGCGAGQDGQISNTPAMAGDACVGTSPTRARGGNGAAGSVEAQNGGGGVYNYGGHGGGGFGRIRINTGPGGLRGSGVISPKQSDGAATVQ